MLRHRNSTGGSLPTSSYHGGNGSASNLSLDPGNAGAYRSDTSLYRKRGSSSSSFSSPKHLLSSSPTPGWLTIAFMLTTALLLISTLSYRASTHTLWATLQGATSTAQAVANYQSMMEQGQQDRKKWMQQREDLRQRLSKQLTECQSDRKSLQTEHKQTETYWKSREAAFTEQTQTLMETIRKDARRSVLDRFGPGPHQVEMTFELFEPLHDDKVKQGESHYKVTQHTFIIELAPLSLVPHAVHLFLEQVAHGLWDNTYFYLNGPHVMQMGPQNMDHWDYEPEEGGDAGRSVVEKAFKDAGLFELAFSDYSDDYPHLPWTVGYSGRPGGPDFYINKVDNTQQHGPGGQYQHMLHEFGDACFGTIVSGQDALAQVFAQPIYNDQSQWHWFIQEPVEIVQAKIVGWTDPALQENDAKTTTPTSEHYSAARQSFVHSMEEYNHHNQNTNPKEEETHAKQEAILERIQEHAQQQQHGVVPPEVRHSRAHMDQPHMVEP